MVTYTAKTFGFQSIRFTGPTNPLPFVLAFQNTGAMHPNTARRTLCRRTVIHERRFAIPTNTAALQIDRKLTQDHSGHIALRLSP